MSASDELQRLLCACTVTVLIPGAQGYGTGFFVAPGMVLTCAHVVAGVAVGQAVELYWNNHPYTATLVECFADVHPHLGFAYPDLALLEVAGVGEHPCVYLHDEIELGERLYSYGSTEEYPYGDSATFEHEGWTDPQQLLLKIKGGQAARGLSGATILNLRTGGVCGIMKRSRDPNDERGARAIPIRAIFQVLPTLREQQQAFHRRDTRWTECLSRLQKEHKAHGQTHTLWNIPYSRNLYFTGRDDILTRLHKSLSATGASAPIQQQAVSGLGGIGKTQIAVEYAYRHRNDYRAVLWVNAANSETIIKSFLELATLFELPERQEADQNVIVDAVRRWFPSHEGWLLIFDNADDLALAKKFLPTSAMGCLLLTTRDQAPGTLAQSQEVPVLTHDEGTALLLRRARLLAPDALLEQASDATREQAGQLVALMDGLPLALDQAAAYIEETGCSLASYLNRYQHEQAALLGRRGRGDENHPLPVATTWAISFRQVKSRDPRASDLLHVCAFLAPDAIPEELFSVGAAELGPRLATVQDHPMQLDEAIGVLGRFSLVRRNTEAPGGPTLSIHRLVQTILRFKMKKPTRQRWAERTVKAVNQAFPFVEVNTWPQCERLLSHALQCAATIETYALALPESALLFNQTGSYLYDRAQYAQAEPLLKRALAIREQVLGPDHSDTAQSLNNLAGLYRTQGQYSQAEPLLKQALAIRERVCGPDHPDTAQSLNNLATLYRTQGQYALTEPLLKRTLAIWEQVLGPDHPHTATSLNNLATLYRTQGQYALAEPLYQRALAISEQVLGPNHPKTQTIRANYAALQRMMLQENG